MVGVLLLALALRGRGLEWGLPTAQHLFSYHPDEWSLVVRAARMAETGDLNPHFFNYGSLPIYFNALVFHLAAKGGLTELQPLGNGLLYLLARLVTVAASLFTVFLTYLLGARLFSRQVGLGAALLLAVTPLHVVHSHYATVDVPLTLWVLLALWAAAHLWPAETPPAGRAAWGWHLLAGMALGWGTATKYNAALALLPVGLASLCWGRQTRMPRRCLLPLALVGSMVVAFLLAEPYAIGDFPQFWHDLKAEMRHAREGWTLTYRGLGPGWWYYLRVGLPTGWGWLPTLMGGAAVLWAGGRWLRTRRMRAEGWLLTWIGPHFLLVSQGRDYFLRYLLPLLPELALLVSALWGEWGLGARGRRAKFCAGSIVAAVLLAAGLKATAYVCLLSRPDVRDLAAQWCFRHLPPGATVGLLNVPWFYTPPLVPYNGGPLLSREEFQTQWAEGPYRLQLIEYGPEGIKGERPEWMVLSEFEFADALRLGHTEIRGLMRDLKRHYRLLFRQRPRPRLFGLTFDAGTAPHHDWLYPMPEVRVYRKDTH